MNPKEWQKIQTLYSKRRYRDAQRKLIKYCKIYSDSAEALVLLGKTCLKLDDTASAKSALGRALSLQPRSVPALTAFGNCLLTENSHEDAKSYFREAIRLQPGMLEARDKYCDCLTANYDSNEARACLQQTLLIKPDHHPAIEKLGGICQREGNHGQAISHYEHAISINPHSGEIHARLARSLHHQGDLEGAARHYREAVKYNQRSIDAYINLGSVLTLLGELDSAIEAYDRSLKLDKNNLDAISGKSRVLVRQNQPLQAYDMVSDYVTKGITHPGVAHLLLRLTPNFINTESVIQYLRSTLDDPRTSKDQEALICFDLGKLHDSAGYYDLAFEYYEHANSLVPSTYDPVGHSHSTQSLIQVCNRKTLSSLPHASRRTDRPIFIVGMPRSGTSLVEQILASHSSVYGAGELKDLGDIASSIQQKASSQKPYPYCLEDMNQVLVDELSNIYIDKINSIDRNALYITDKMPHNFIHLGLVELLFPQARIIHCTRNPLDTCLSIYFQKFNASHSYANDIYDLGYHFREYEKIMEHWKRTISLPMLDINYESVVINITKETKKLLAFCDLEWEEQCMQFYKSGRFVNTASNEQVNKPIYSDSVGRWKHYEKHIQPLISLLGRVMTS